MGIKEESEEEATMTVMDLMKVLGLETSGEVQILGRIGRAGENPRPIWIKLGNWENRRRVLLSGVTRIDWAPLQPYLSVPPPWV